DLHQRFVRLARVEVVALEGFSGHTHLLLSDDVAAILTHSWGFAPPPRPRLAPRAAPRTTAPLPGRSQALRARRPGRMGLSWSRAPPRRKRPARLDRRLRSAR